MAKRTKRTTARKAKTRGKRQTRAKNTKRKAAKQLGKARPKRQMAKAKAKRSVAKRSASKQPMTPTQPSALQSATTIIDVIEEPAPGVIVVTEFEETRTHGSDTTKSPE